MFCESFVTNYQTVESQSYPQDWQNDMPLGRILTRFEPLY